MNHHSSTIKKYYPALVGAALIAASLFQFSRPVFSAGTAAGQKIRNTATGTYKDDAPIPNTYTIDSNTVEVTVAKVAGITNIPTGLTDTNGGSILTGDEVSFEFTITNVGNAVSDIYIPGTAANIATKGLDESDMVVEVNIDPEADPDTFVDYSTLTGGIVPNVPINGKIIVRVTAKVTATAAGAPIEVQLGDTGPNTDINSPVAATQNQFDDAANGDAAKAANEVLTQDVNGATGINKIPDKEQKEASAVRQVSLGSNPMAMTKILKTRVYDTTPANVPDVNPNTKDNVLTNNIITYKLGLEVLTSTPSNLYTPGKLEGRDFTGRMPASISDETNLVLVSDAIPVGTHLNSFPTSVTDADGREWTPVYSVSPEPSAVTDENKAADNIEWKAEADVNLTDVTRVGWVYDANSAEGVINPGATITGFTFDVVTDGLTSAGGTVANIAQVFGRTYDEDPDNDPDTHTGEKIFDESGDQNPSNFSGANPGPKETATGSTGIANPSGHGVDTNNNNNPTADSPGGEDNVITISEAGKLLNGPNDQPTAIGNIFITNPNNNHDFQNKGSGNLDGVSCTPAIASGNPQSGKGCTVNPKAVTFDNTLSNPGATDLKNVLLQPINPEFNSFGGDDEKLPVGTKVTIKLGTQQAIYTYTLSAGGNYSFVLDGNTTANPSQPIKIPTLAAGVPLNYKVTVDLPAGTKLSTDVGHGYAVPIIAFVDPNNNGTPDTNENSNYTVNQVYTDFIKIEKQVKVMRNGADVSGMGYSNDNEDKLPIPGDVLVYRVNYRNISEPQVGNGGNLVLNGIDVMIDENGTQAGINGMAATGNNWGMDSDDDDDDDLDTINVQNTATDSSTNSEITYWTGQSDPGATSKYSVESLTAAGTTDPGVTVTGYRVTIPTLAPAETATDNSVFSFQRKVDKYDGLVEEGLN
jgi:hypothetical protein